MNAELLELLQSSSYDAWQGCKANGFHPTPAQAEVMATVRAATDSGLFYSRDVAYEWLAGATTIINAIDRYAARKARRAA